MMALWFGFWSGEDGAVSTDWVVITAAIVGMTLAIFQVLTTQIPSSLNKVMTTASQRVQLD